MRYHLTKKQLVKLYLDEKESVCVISRKFNCSQNKINYWLKQFGIKKRTISEAVYLKKNPNGDPFSLRMPRYIEEAILYGMGIGLYWGEGNKANKNTVRLGNSDPVLLKYFISFLTTFFQINQSNLRYHLQLFADVDIPEAIKYWKSFLHFKDNQLYKTTVTPSTRKGTYKFKNPHGVLTVYYSNVKLRNKIVSLLPL